MVRVHDTPFVLIPVMMPVSLLPVTIAIDFMCTHVRQQTDMTFMNAWP